MTPPIDQPPLPLVLTALQAYADQALHDNDIYEITGYGWSDHDTIDPRSPGTLSGRRDHLPSQIGKQSSTAAYRKRTPPLNKKPL